MRGGERPGRRAREGGEGDGFIWKSKSGTNRQTTARMHARATHTTPRESYSSMHQHVYESAFFVNITQLAAFVGLASAAKERGRRGLRAPRA